MPIGRVGPPVGRPVSQLLPFLLTFMEALYTIALTQMPGLTPQHVRTLLCEMGSAAEVYAHRHELAGLLRRVLPAAGGHFADWSDALRRAEEELSFVRRFRVEVLTYGAAAYPKRLRECPDAPAVLYFRGSALLDAPRVVSVVGTRRCTPQALDRTEAFVRQLQARAPGTLVVSGLAYGIDHQAHVTALSCGLPTVAVMGTGLDRIYPAAHRDTAVRIMASGGGLLTEYPSRTIPFGENFRRRNRIVAGLADAVVVVETPEHGGSMLTARLAASYDRPVFAFPGSLDAEGGRGLNRLIRSQVAGLIASADDFLSDMGWAGELP